MKQRAVKKIMKNSTHPVSEYCHELERRLARKKNTLTDPMSEFWKLVSMDPMTCQRVDSPDHSTWYLDKYPRGLGCCGITCVITASKAGIEVEGCLKMGTKEYEKLLSVLRQAEKRREELCIAK